MSCCPEIHFAGLGHFLSLQTKLRSSLQTPHKCKCNRQPWVLQCRRSHDLEAGLLRCLQSFMHRQRGHVLTAVSNTNNLGKPLCSTSYCAPRGRELRIQMVSMKLKGPRTVWKPCFPVSSKPRLNSLVLSRQKIKFAGFSPWKTGFKCCTEKRLSLLAFKQHFLGNFQCSNNWLLVQYP